MSYRCEKCNEAQAPGERPTKVVTEIRTYHETPGWQIAKEVNACEGCAEGLMNAGPRETKIAPPKGSFMMSERHLPEFRP